MSILNVNKIQPVGGATTISMSGRFDFDQGTKINGDLQELDDYGIIKANRTTINQNITIPAGTNGMSIGPLTVGAATSITIDGSWTIV